MNLQEYQQLTGRTNVNLGSPAINAAHVTLGIVGEWGEFNVALQHINFNLSKEETNKEGGDILWYTSELANVFQLKLEEEEFKLYRLGVEGSISEVAEMMKKFLAYSKPVDLQLLSLHLNNIVAHIAWHLEDNGFDLEQCLFDNIEKLKLRFPEKFSAELAIQQNDMK